jgi:DNA-binding CsgD family transcriptional regulator
VSFSEPARAQTHVAPVIPFPAQRDEAVELTAEERDCLGLAANGYDARVSSKLLSASSSTFVSEESVRSVQMRARHKLKARSLAHAVAIALDRGLIELGD